MEHRKPKGRIYSELMKVSLPQLHDWILCSPSNDTPRFRTTRTEFRTFEIGIGSEDRGFNGLDGPTLSKSSIKFSLRNSARASGARHLVAEAHHKQLAVRPQHAS